MRIPVLMVFVGMLFACAVVPRSGSDPIEPPRPVEPQPGSIAPSAAESASATVSVPHSEPPAEPSSEEARILAEVETMDRAERWAWAVSAMPDLAGHSEIDPAPEHWAEFRRRASGRPLLWVRSRGTRCFVARGVWEDEEFHGRAHVATTITGDTKLVRYESIRIDAYGITLTGPHGEDFTRDRRGRWQETGGYGVGSMRTVAERSISAVRSGAAYYGGYVYTLTIECRGRISYEERCTDGTTRRCERCGGLWAHPHADGMGWGTGGVSGWGTGARLRDCSEPCPPDPDTPRIPALNLAVKGRRFFDASDPVASVYTSRKACEGDPRMHR
jgi:hypothetical protein